MLEVLFISSLMDSSSYLLFSSSTNQVCALFSIQLHADCSHSVFSVSEFVTLVTLTHRCSFLNEPQNAKVSDGAALQVVSSKLHHLQSCIVPTRCPQKWKIRCGWTTNRWPCAANKSDKSGSKLL